MENEKELMENIRRNFELVRERIIPIAYEGDLHTAQDERVKNEEEKSAQAEPGEKEYGACWPPEDKLTRSERLALAYTRLNEWGWDELLGEKPEGYDEMERYPILIRDHQDYETTKNDVINPILLAIREMIGEVELNRCHHMYNMGESEQEWIRWYIHQMTQKEREPRKAPRAAETKATRTSMIQRVISFFFRLF